MSCKHHWVNTGLRATWCKWCDVSGDWVGDKVILRRPSESFAHSLEVYGIPILYNHASVEERYGRLNVTLSGVFVTTDWGEMPAGRYHSINIEQDTYNPDRCLVSRIAEYWACPSPPQHFWETFQKQLP
jgi:hypothetical protein